LNRAEAICFLAAPCAPEAQANIDILVGTLEDIGVNCVVAERRQKFSQDIFCQKICRPIIESRFCILLLQECAPALGAPQAPNPNVYYEYGLMCSLRKLAVAFTPTGQHIPFNVSHLDLVQYDPPPLPVVAADALQSAVAITASRYGTDGRRQIRRSRRAIPRLIRAARRVVELRGFRLADPSVVGVTECEGTQFEAHVGDAGVCFMALLGNDGATSDEIRKDAIVLADRLGKTWERARRMNVAARSRRWTAQTVERDMQLLAGSRLLIIAGVTGDELTEAREALGQAVSATFGDIPLDLWDGDRLAVEESGVGLR